MRLLDVRPQAQLWSPDTAYAAEVIHVQSMPMMTAMSPTGSRTCAGLYSHYLQVFIKAAPLG
ncbi:hypothetical protein PISMIDRAFT_683084 [Pisolithus microcarpus 441]|uniref:Uncharacterized protein n=1 Tax=Pisolithus microcarpus 441 TaxID=765257 RepID=A0A0C9ZHH8_9AGAM|nr:hypothetical protein PISMIDRAFT_683084 [Pisolithus microcarpus 441]